MGGIGDGSIQVLVFYSIFSVVLIDYKLGKNINGPFDSGCFLYAFATSCALYELLISAYLLIFQLWSVKPGWGSRPDTHVEKAHSDDITGLKFSSDGRILLSRSFDGSMKVNGICYLDHIIFNFD